MTLVDTDSHGEFHRFIRSTADIAILIYFVRGSLRCPHLPGQELTLHCCQCVFSKICVFAFTFMTPNLVTRTVATRPFVQRLMIETFFVMI